MTNHNSGPIPHRDAPSGTSRPNGGKNPPPPTNVRPAPPPPPPKK